MVIKSGSSYVLNVSLTSKLEIFGLTALKTEINLLDPILKAKYLNNFVVASDDVLNSLNRHPKSVRVWKTYTDEAQKLIGQNAEIFAKHFEVRPLMKLGKFQEAVALYGGEIINLPTYNGAKWLGNMSNTLKDKCIAIINRTDDVAKIGANLRAAGYNVSDDIVAQVKKHYFETEHLAPIYGEPDKFAKARFSKDPYDVSLWNDAIAGKIDKLEEVYKLMRHEFIELELMKSGIPYRGLLNVVDGSFLKYGAHELSTNFNSEMFLHWTLPNDAMRKIIKPNVSTNFNEIIEEIKLIEGL